MKPEEFAPQGDEVDLIVYVFNDFELGKVADELRHAGVLVERELPLSGIVGIRAARSRIGELQRLPGIRLIRESQTYQLPPFSGNFPQ